MTDLTNQKYLKMQEQKSERQPQDLLDLSDQEDNKDLYLHWQQIIENELKLAMQKTNIKNINGVYKKVWFNVLFFLSFFIFFVCLLIVILISAKTIIFSNLFIPMLIMAIIFFILFMIMEFMLFLTTFKNKKLKQNINFQKIYAAGMTVIFENVFEFDEISKEFKSGLEEKFLLKQGEIKIDKVLNFKYEDNIFSFGSFTQKNIIEQNNETYVNYICFPILSIKLQESLNFYATINPTNFLKNLIDKSNVNLESSEFKKKYNINSDDQIKIRKLLTPKIMVNLIKLTNSARNVPNMEFNKDQVVFTFKPFSIEKWDCYLNNFSIKGPNFKAMVQSIMDNVTSDFNKLEKALYWFDAFEINI